MSAHIHNIRLMLSDLRESYDEGMANELVEHIEWVQMNQPLLNFTDRDIVNLNMLHTMVLAMREMIIELEVDDDEGIGE